MLVATTVIEVGVDVPNATVMVVEDADRFGLLQLHQLRGRIGRGAHASVCFLLADPSTAEGQARMEAMAASSDGFELAERDLEIRGAGEVFGERQSGWTDLKLGRLPRDEPVVVERAGDGRGHPRRRSRSRRAPAAARGGRGPARRRRRVPVQGLRARRSTWRARRRPSGRLRVVAGRAGGRRLASLPGEATRPTTERVREAVFSSLGGDVVGASVLDLYAGTGAMAIEALSRGADRAVLVDHDRAAAAVCRDNLATTGFDDVGRVVETTVSAFLALPPPPEAPFTLVTCDPPYATPDDEIAAVLAALTVPGLVGAERDRGRGARRAHARRSGATGLATPVRAGLRGYARDPLDRRGVRPGDLTGEETTWRPPCARDRSTR